MISMVMCMETVDIQRIWLTAARSCFTRWSLHPIWMSYKAAINNPNIINGYKNTMFIGGGLTPNYLLVKQPGMYDTHDSRYRAVLRR